MGIDSGRYEYFESVASGMAAERLCEHTVVEFTMAFDLGDCDRMAELFAEDGVWKRQDGEIAGIQQLRQMMNSRPPGLFVRHVLTNMRITFLSAVTAVVDSYVTVYRHDFPGEARRPAPLSGPNLVGRYRDRLSLKDAVWKLAGREVLVDFKQQQEQPQ